MKMQKRPHTTTDGATVTTPRAATLVALLGPGVRAESIVLTRDEYQAINKLYGYVTEEPRERPPEPPDPGPDPGLWGQGRDEWKEAKEAHDHWRNWEDPRSFMQAGADRNALRYAGHDGKRLLAWMAKYIEPGADPLKLLVQLASDAGWDVDPSDIEWANEE